jgi:Fe-S-cluster-containing hydrogenase component 2
LGQTTFEVESDTVAGRHTATATAEDFVQLVRIKAADFPRVLESSAETAAAIDDVARGRRQIEAQVLGRVQQVSLTDFLNQDLMQGQDVLLLNLDRCTRCDECSKACVATHPDGISRLVRDGLRFQEYLVTTSCRACLDPLCMTHCPVGAIRRKGSSLDIVIEDWCIGCCNCAQDCPYGAINVVELPSAGAVTDGKPSTRPMATVCDLCQDYPEPNCVRACPHDAAMRVQPSFFFARDLAGVQLTVKPKPPAPVSSAIGTETKILSSADLVSLVPRLVVEDSREGNDPLPPGHQRSFPLRIPGTTTFGREPGNTWVLQNHSVSKKHASIECQGPRFTLQNLSVVNVTLVNDQPVSVCDLHTGDLIEMGEVKMKFLGGLPQ